MKPGYTMGRRPKDLRMEKSEMMELCGLLHARGLGARTIASLLGYDPNIIHQYMRSAGLPRHGPGTIRDAIVRCLPLELAAQCARVKTRSEIARARKTKESPSRVIHHLLDDDADSCANRGGAVRPEETEAA